MSKISPATTPAVDAAELAAIVASLEKKVAKLEGKSGDEEGSEAPPESPYSFAFGALLNPQSGIAAQIWSCTLLYVMLFFQIMLCFGFSDTSDLMSDQGSYNLYATPVPMGNFYSNVLAGPTAGAPTITVLTGILAILILATNVKDNCTSGVLQAVYPIEYVLFLAEPKDLPKQALQIVLLLFAWFCRAMLLPMMVCYGSVKLWNSEGTATDIVKDSVVATYVLELDGVFYAMAAPALRAGYETFGGMAVAPGRSGGWIAFGEWAVYTLDVWFLIDYWLGPGAQGITGFTGSITTLSLTAFCAVRFALIGLANVGFIYSSPDTHNKGLCGMMGGAEKPAVKYVCLAICFATVFAFSSLFQGIYVGLVDGFGYKALPSSGSDLFDCINSPIKKVECINLA